MASDDLCHQINERHSVTFPTFYGRIHRWENNGIRGRHARHLCDVGLPRIQIRGGLSYPGIMQVGGSSEESHFRLDLQEALFSTLYKFINFST